MQRSGFIEEAYFDYANVPLIGSGGTIWGILNTVRETTKAVLAQRRLSTWTNIRHHMSNFAGVDDLCRRLLQGLDTNKQDAVFAIIYAQDLSAYHVKSTPESYEEVQDFPLRGSIGLPELGLPSIIENKSTVSPFSSLLQTANECHHYIVLPKDDKELAGLRNLTVSSTYGHGAGFEQAFLYVKS